MNESSYSCVVQLLLNLYPERYNINQIARKVPLSVGGVFKSLTILEREGILSSKNVGNAKLYQINFSSEKGRKFSELIIFQKNKNLLLKLSKILDKISSFSDDILMVFYKKGKKPELFFVLADFKIKEITKEIAGVYSYRFSSFAEFKKNLENLSFFKKFWSSYIPVYGESLFFRLIGETFNENK